MTSHWDLLKPYLPNDHSRQVNSQYYVDLVMSRPSPPPTVLDLGCGVGASLRTFRKHRPDVNWIGVDIPASMESQAREPLPAPVVLFDGERLPFADGVFPLIYCHQVLEHVEQPRAVLAEVSRVLAPGGEFIGSTSQMEPYHSRSLWNYTMYGFLTLVQEAGLAVRELRPSIDGITLTRRAYEGRPPEMSKYFVEESPLNEEIEAWGRRSGRSPARINNRKLLFCGQFAFHVVKPGPQSDRPRLSRWSRT